jgi:hypothetical protein
MVQLSVLHDVRQPQNFVSKSHNALFKFRAHMLKGFFDSASLEDIVAAVKNCPYSKHSIVLTGSFQSPASAIAE